MVSAFSNLKVGVSGSLQSRLFMKWNHLSIAAIYTADDAEKFKTIVSFDCRGVEPTEFSARTGWIVKSAEGGQTFEDVDFSDDDWVEFDQKNNVSIGVYSFASQFIKLKK